MPCFSHLIKDEILPFLRLDRYVSENLRLLSRSQIKARNLKAKINGKDVKVSRIVKQGDLLYLFWEDEPPLNLLPQDLPLEIVLESKRYIVINKAQGMVVHPGAGNRQGTLANAILFRMQNLGKKKERDQQMGQISKNEDSFCEQSAGVRPGIVHRLDKETSGIIIAAYDDETHAFLSRQFKNRRVKKTYITIVCGTPKEQKGCIDTFITRDSKDRKRFTVAAQGAANTNYKGKRAVTFYKVIKSFKNYSLVLLRPRTGRTHQLRVHMRHLGCPILGDSVYGRPDKTFPNASLMLHSKSLKIVLPAESQPRVFSSPVPSRFLEIIKKGNNSVI